MRSQAFISATAFHKIKQEKPGGLDKRLPFEQTENLNQLSDEALCRNARQGCAISKNLLWQRYSDFIRRVTSRENRHHHLPQSEIDDALQELYFAFHTAVERYDPEKHGNGGKPASFKTFLSTVVAHKFSNYCARWRIYYRRVVLNDDIESLLTFTGKVEKNGPFPVDQREENDHSYRNLDMILQNEFFPEALEEVLYRLKPKERALLETWLQHGRDRAVAEELGISPEAAKLRRQRLFRRIRKNVIGK